MLAIKKVSLFLPLLLLASLALHAQSAEKVSEIIKTSAATYGQVAYLVGVYQNTVPETASYTQAFETLQKNGVITASVKANDAISLQETSFLCAQAANLSGGLFYGLFHNARYAYKELKAKGILPQTADSDAGVSGRDVIAVLNGCISEAGGTNE